MKQKALIMICTKWTDEAWEKYRKRMQKIPRTRQLSLSEVFQLQSCPRKKILRNLVLKNQGKLYITNSATNSITAEINTNLGTGYGAWNALWYHENYGGASGCEIYSL